MKDIHQTVLPLPPSTLAVHQYPRRIAGHATRALKEASTISNDTGESDLQSKAFGISISQLGNGTIAHIAFATDTAVYLVDADRDVRGNATVDRSFRNFLESTTTVLAGFDMPRIALRLRHHLGHHIRGVDLSTLFSSSTSTWHPSKVVQKLCEVKDRFGVDRLWHENDQDERSVEKLCLRAWISAKVARSVAARQTIESARRVDTRHLKKAVLLRLGSLLRQTDVLARAVPRVTKNEHGAYKSGKKQNMELQNARYKTRVRVSTQSYVEVVSDSGKIHRGRAIRASGKTTEISFSRGIPTTVSSICIVGLDEPTPAEKARDALLLRALQDEENLLDADFVRFLWFVTKEDEDSIRPSPKSSRCLKSLKAYLKDLNGSQAEVVKAMTSQDPIVVVHGPPGTGKTTTIASAAEIWSKIDSLPVWIVGHSNVSVKNIAEKLLKEKVDFKLIVSKEFYLEWHEHIYEQILKNLIRTDELPDNILGMSRLIGSSKVILSTLGLLSNPTLEQNGLYDVVPFERLVVDEASQINVFEYMHIFHKFRKSLVKVSFFGDPKQLPPFGQEEAQTLQSIFDIEHLKPSNYFLDTQYRMPVPLGNFISQKVYEGRLKSRHKTTSHNSVRFVNTPRGVEKKKGSSWTVSYPILFFIMDYKVGFSQNEAEIDCIVNLVRNYYQKTDFCIITPYDSQRAAIESRLKDENLPWEKVFNVDSFQGNEADYVLISVVRSAHVGFLRSPQRMNVMLTRCRLGMVIVSSKSFLNAVARRILLGEISAYWTAREGKKSWVEALDVMNSRVDLPGVIAFAKSS
ncbi:MAG: P-loop containing nucleoside triphosphate hydrolase protein [Lentinula lateritia]|nr:MAG: P-loop containing nucleoside triphosphate hydrolase protein [Lentinula lateritia]